MGKTIGIDLGTTNSCVAVMEGGEPVVIANAEGTRTTPSVVAFTKTGERLVGQVAKRQSVTNPKNTIYSIKRFMGRKFSEVSEEAKNVPYTVKEGKNGEAVVEIDGKLYSPPEISAMILQKMKQTAEDYLGEKVTEAVITVPAYFNDSQRQATKDAGRIAGLDVKRIINEPTAAALAYGLDKKKDEKIAVYDLGGGTFDISILELGDGVFEVKSTNGDTHLGGDDFDKRVIDWLAEEFKKQEGIDLRKDPMALQRLKEAAEKAKIELSTVMQTDVNLPFITADASGPKHLNLTLTRSKYEQLVDDLIERSRPAGRARAFGRRPQAGRHRRGDPRGRRHPDPQGPGSGEEALRGQGAAQGRESRRGRRDRRGHPGRRPGGRREGRPPARRDAALARHRDAGRREHQADRAQHHDPDQEERGLLDRGRQPDRRSRSTCSRASDRWPATTRRSAASRSTGIPPAPRGIPQIEVTFDIDANGILHVTARDKATGKEQKIRIEASGGLSEAEIKKMVTDAESHADEDGSAATRSRSRTAATRSRTRPRRISRNWARRWTPNRRREWKARWRRSRRRSSETTRTRSGRPAKRSPALERGLDQALRRRVQGRRARRGRRAESRALPVKPAAPTRRKAATERSTPTTKW